MASPVSTLLQQLLARVNYVNVTQGGVTTAVLTLDSALAQWSYQAISGPAVLQGQAPAAAAASYAAFYCGQSAPPDCSQQASLAATYGAIVAAAIAGNAIPPLPDVTAAGSSGTTGGRPVGGPTDGTPAPPPADTSGTPQAQFIAAAGAGLDVGGAIGSLASAAVTFGISIAVDVLVSALFGGLFGGGDVKQLQQDVQNLRNALAQTADELERFSWSIAFALGKTWLAIANIWDNFLDALWTYMKQLWNLLWVLVSEVVPKIINVLRDLRKFLDDIYVKYILPAMRYLLYVRQVLAILRALGVPIASKLDKILTQIQGALFAPFLYLLRSLNGYGGWFNFMLTSGLTLQRPLFINTMYAYQADWINMFYTAQSGQLGPVGVLGPAAQGTSSFAAAFGPGGTDGSSTDTTAQVMTVAEACSWIAVFAATGSGELADTAQATLAALNQQLGI